MGFIENLLDSFSAKDLKTRVKGVVALGLALCAATGVALYWLLTTSQGIEVEGTGRWKDEAKGVLVVSIDEGDISKVAGLKAIKVEFLDPASGATAAECSILSMEPAPASVIIQCPDLPPSLRALKKMETTLVLLDEPMWRMLWGRSI